MTVLLVVTTGLAQTPTPTPGCTDDTWTATSVANSPTGRVEHTGVWTGSDMIVWGGVDASGNFVNSGGRYNPITDTWTATSTSNVPDPPRSGHTVVWTGSEMIVWGGNGNIGQTPYRTGGRYNPSVDNWTATSIINAPSGRYLHTAIWTGSEMIVWGGADNIGASLDTGKRYDPTTDTWITISNTNAATPRKMHTAVWTGSEMIVWGGFINGQGNNSWLNTGGKYNPATDTWTSISTDNAPAGRYLHKAVWTGSEMIVWGGNGVDYVLLNDGGRYDPATDTWTSISTTGAPIARSNNTVVWTASEMIVWGGSGLNTGARYDSATDSWTATSTTAAPAARGGHTAVWTGSEMIVWGGSGGSGFLNTGGRYCAQPPTTPTPTPSPTPTATATATATPTATATATATPTVAPSATATATGTPTATATATATPTVAPSATPPLVFISGTISYCSNPVPGPVPNVTLTLTGDATTSTTTDGSGNYMFSSVAAGGSYDVTPSKAARTPGSTGINTIDVIATQRHFLNIALLSGCRRDAADVNGDGVINTVDVSAIQRFFFGRSTGIANTGKYKFIPVSRSYLGLVSDQTAQNYDTLIFGDVASHFVE
jgi:N-acetylneuraminic acid mutarotase